MADALEDVLDQLEQAGGDGAVSVGEVLDAFAERSLGALLTVFSAIAAMPLIGAIPGASIVTGALILLAIAQSLFAEGGIWAPERLRKLEVDRDKLDRALEKSRPVARWIDKWLKPRLRWAVEGRAQRWLIAAICAGLAVLFFPAAVIPWGVQAPSLAILAFGLALLAGDGLFALIGYAVAALSAALLWQLI